MIHAIKRSGARVPYDHNRVLGQIARACEGIENVSVELINNRAAVQVYDGITTLDIDKALLSAMINLIDENLSPDNHVNYQYVAGRQRLAMLRKDVFGKYEPDHLLDVVRRTVAVGLYTPDLLKWYTPEEFEQLQQMIDHTKDEKYSYAALEQLATKYLVRNRVTDVIYETPQIRYIIAAATAFHMEDKAVRMKYVEQFYQASSNGLFTLATPVLAGLGTISKQFSSCVLLRSDDTLPSIFATGTVMANYAANSAGIGLEVGRLRPLNAPVKNGRIKHTGLVPFIKKWFGDLRSCSQGGLRNASATITFPIWHYQVQDLIVLKNNQGTEETRVRHMDYSVVMSGLFWKRFVNKQNITLFDPNEVPDLYEAYYRNSERFEELYTKYERLDQISHKKVVSAEALIKQGLLKERTDTGRIYIVNIDNVINQGTFDSEHHPVYQSNLCQEILLSTRPFQSLEDREGRIALCTLGSINLGKFESPEQMKTSAAILVRALSNLLGYQDYMSIQSKLSTEEFEPLGVGITNLSYWAAKRGLQYGSAAMLSEVKTWIEHLSYYLIEQSVTLAAERGPCKLSQDTWYGKGVFPWERRNQNVNELADFTPTLNWEALRSNLLKYGIRNATLMAVAPVESSSVVIDSTNGVEMPMQLISVKESKAASLVQVVPEYHKLKDQYQLMWDQADCVDYLKTMAVIAAYVDQSISTNTFYNPKHFADGKIPATLIAKNIILAYKWGLKTLYYSLMCKEGSKASLAVQSKIEEVVEEILEDSDCESCKL